MLKVANSVINASQIATPITFAGDVTLSTGNLVIGTSGKGIDFSATSHPAGMTSELLADYEEGTWTPSLGGTTTYNAQTGNYTKVGNLVYVRFNLNIAAIGTGSTTTVTGLPFTPRTPVRYAGSMAYWAGLATNVLYLGVYADVFSEISFVSQTVAGVNVTDGPAILGTGAVMQAAITYYV